MRARVGIALLLAALTGTGLLIAYRNRDETPPAPPPSPPGAIAPEVQPRPESARAPAESLSGDDPGEPLEPIGRESSEPDEPDDIEIRQGAEMKLRTGPDGQTAPAEAPDPPKPPVDAGPTPEPVGAPEPEKPPRKEKELLPGKEVAPLPGPVDDPADLPTPEEIEEGTAPTGGEEPPAQDTLLAGLNDLLRVMTLDGRIQLKFTGRLYIDAALMSAEQELEDLAGDFNSGGQFRAARVGLLGVIDWFEFKIDYDVAGGQTLVGEPELRDLWIGARDIPLIGRLRVGRMKEPLGLEQWMSGNARTFMEPALPKAITIGRNPGVQAGSTELKGRLFWWAGVFGHTPENNQFGVPGANISVRVCGTPWFEDKGARLLHVGMSTSFRLSRTDEQSIAQRPEAHFAPNIVATPEYVAERRSFQGLEVAYKDGPFSLQGEWQRTSVQTMDSGTSVFWGAYIYGSYILTGEGRVYRNGRFQRPRVKRVAFDGGIGGAFEIAVRLSHLDLASGKLDGGTVTDGTLGLTWYMDDHSRFMVNYIRSNRRGVGSVNILQCRLQIDF